MTTDISQPEASADVTYPLVVEYCGECSMPFEYCEYSAKPESCRKWLETHAPQLMERLEVKNDDANGETEKKHQKRGGKGSKPAGDKAASAKKTGPPPKLTLQRAPRGRNKFVTVIKGLGSFDVDLKAAAKFFAGKFACGSSVTSGDEIVVQGDVKDELLDIITEKWPHIDEEFIEDLGDQKR
ncbi:hypothetical protein AB6A40_006238 [Gnathostoma spinigerum]|uniref:Density-regulated protein n=1 Tax=Gnathostoma spinigerum TaxID=75299 RepID=A0ABD6EHS8_9BILA